MNIFAELFDESTVGDFIELPINKKNVKIILQLCIVEKHCNIPSIYWFAAENDTSIFLKKVDQKCLDLLCSIV